MQSNVFEASASNTVCAEDFGTHNSALHISQSKIDQTFETGVQEFIPPNPVLPTLPTSPAPPTPPTPSQSLPILPTNRMSWSHDDVEFDSEPSSTSNCCIPDFNNLGEGNGAEPEQLGPLQYSAPGSFLDGPLSLLDLISNFLFVNGVGAFYSTLSTCYINGTFITGDLSKTSDIAEHLPSLTNSGWAQATKGYSLATLWDLSDINCLARVKGIGTKYLSTIHSTSAIEHALLDALTSWCTQYHPFQILQEKHSVEGYRVHCDRLIMMILRIKFIQTASDEEMSSKASSDCEDYGECEDNKGIKEDIISLGLDWDDMEFADGDADDEHESQKEPNEDGHDTLTSLDAIDNRAPYPVFLNAIQKQHAEMLRESCANPDSSEEHSWKHIICSCYPYQMSMKTMKVWIEPALPRLQFRTQDGPDFTFNGKSLSVTSITQMYHSAYWDMVHILEEDHLFRASDVDLQPLKMPEEIMDKPHEHVLGCGILVSEMQAAWNLMKFIMSNEKLLKKYFTIDSSGHPIPHKGAWEKYLEDIEAFKEYFYFLFHQIPGMPKRGAEEIQAKIVDTSFHSRNLMYLFHHLACIGNYNKSSQNSGNDKLTLHFLARPLEIVLRRFQASVASIGAWAIDLVLPADKYLPGNVSLNMSSLRHILPGIAEHYRISDILTPRTNDVLHSQLGHNQNTGFKEDLPNEDAALSLQASYAHQQSSSKKTLSSLWTSGPIAASNPDLMLLHNQDLLEEI
ncbi:hypothetical protein BDR07DRAFT_1373857 [Suillus spraguei]|nr:hypothetical protein BDR07DRAFT_1373857 [Suillus spraguei]